MSTQHSPIHPGSGYASPAGSVLLPPIEIEVSPAHSYRSSSSFRRHYSDDSSSDESDSKSRDPPPTATATTMQAGNTRTSNTFTKTFSAETSSSVMSFSRKGEVEEYENNPHLYGPGMLQRSGSKQSITLKEYGRWGQLRRSPNFILFTVFLALFVDMATYGIIVPIIPFIVSDRISGGATDTGLLLAMYAIGILLSSPLFGVLGDAFVSRRTPMLIGLLGMLVSTVLFMVASNFYVFLAARLLQGVAGGSVWTLGLALITDVFPAEVLGVQMGKALIGYTLGLMMGPPLGGLLYEHGGYQAPFVFISVITLIDFGCRALIIEEREEIVKALRQQGKKDEAIEEEAEVVATRKKERMEERTSFWKLLKNKRLVGCVIVTACNAFVFSGAEPTVPLYLARSFDLTSEKIGLVFMAFSLPTLTAPLSGALSDRFGAKVVCFVSLLLCGAGVLATGMFQNSLTMIILLFAVVGITGTAILTPILGELSAVVRTTGSGDGFARAYAMFNMAFSIGVLVGPVICGIVYERLGFRAITCVMAGSLFIATPVVLLWIGGAEQKKQDLIKYKEDDAFRRSRIPRSKYSLEFSASGVSANTEELGLVGLEGEKQTQVLSKPVSRDDIQKYARID
ncbi:hypothetical protein CPB97_006157 [Podila verticillata]|nr:hypothetical protein CPB97_006157 [Podila verticillata]